MKKLNRKGFTLVELLAVIIILAIVVGITIPAITNVINDSKNSALGVIVDTAEDYLADQFALYNVDTTAASEAFTDVITGPVTSTMTLTVTENPTTDTEKKHNALLQAMGFKLANVSEVKFQISQTGVACVTVTKIPTDSEYYSTKYFTVTAGVAAPNTSNDVPKYYSRSCSAALN